MRHPVLLILCVCFACQVASGQDSVSDTHLTKAAYNNAVSHYHRFTDKKARLYNGVHHIGYPHLIEGFAYYPANSWETGTVVYDGIMYADVQLRYDAYQDELVILHFSRLLVSLHSEKVKEFSFAGRHFIRLVGDTVKYSWLRPGFYEKLHTGNVTLIARRRKFIEEKVTDQVEQRFLLNEFFFIHRNDTWYIVKSYKSLLKILGEHAKAIRQYLKKNKVKYRRNREAAITMAVQHFEALTK